MNGNGQDEKLLHVLQELGLEAEEAKIYMMILKQGKKGMIVKDIIKNYPIKRTTCYSLLNRLMKKSFIREGKYSNTPQKAKTYVSLEPLLVFRHLIRNKKEKLKKFEELSLMHSDQFQKIYQEGMKFSLSNLNPFVKPYLQPLLEQGWKIKSQIVEKTSEFFNFDIYDYDLTVPKAKFIDESGFHAFVFQEDIEENFKVQEFLIDQLKRKTKSEIIHKSGFKDVKIDMGKITLFSMEYPSIIVQIKFPGSKQYQEISKIAILPIHDKIFGIWAESIELVEEMSSHIFKEEGIKIK